MTAVKPIHESQLGKPASYINTYQPDLLFPIARSIKRAEIHISTPLPFYGYDLWNAYELSWLNEKGKPLVAIAEFVIPCTSPNIIESKSLELYLNSLNHTRFVNIEQVHNCLTQDLTNAAGKEVQVKIVPLSAKDPSIGSLTGICLDELDIQVNDYLVNPKLLILKSSQIVKEKLYSHLLKSNCLVTGQPDWASIEIEYQGPKINHDNLLKYLVSFRNHHEFHEQCVERIFMDLQRYCQPLQLTVRAYYTRRGGIDINPVRSTEKNIAINNTRLIRQ